ncbi:hypothetical protein MKX62_20825 [Sporosarcina sp. FSL K6-5500]
MECHPQSYDKTLAKFTGESGTYEDCGEIVNEHLYECSECGLEPWVDDQWVRSNAVEEVDVKVNWTFEKLDLTGALKDIQTDCDICKIAINNGNKNAKSLVYWKNRYNRMVSVANALRVIISFDDSRFSEPYSTKRFKV